MKSRGILSRGSLAVLAVIFHFIGGLATAQESETTSSAKRDNSVEMALRDGSLVRGTLSIQLVEVETPYGKLTVPLSDITRIRMGRNAAPDLKARIESLIAKLGDNSFQIREQAQADLAKMGAQAFNELTAALESKDAEIVSRAKILLEAMDAEESTDPPLDEVETKLFLITGTIKLPEITIATAHGTLKIGKPDILSITFAASEGEVGNKAVQFDGSGMITYANAANFTKNGFVWERWIKVDERIEHACLTQFTQRVAILLSNHNGIYTVNLGAIGSGGILASTDVSDGKWHLVRVAVDSALASDGQNFNTSSVKIWIDGKPQKLSLIGSGHYWTPLNNCSFIDGKNEFVPHFKGAMKGAVLFKTTKGQDTDEAARASYNNGRGVRHKVTADVEALWHFDDGKGNTVTDATGKHKGTFTNGVKWIETPRTEK